MRKRGLFLVTLFAVTFSVIFSQSQVNFDQNFEKLLKEGITNPNSASLHTPFFIVGNVAMDVFFAGHGTDGLSWTTAHVIENLTINANGVGSGINIRNTNLYLIIRNVTVTNSGYSPFADAGIYLEYCENVRITNCTLVNNVCGIKFEGSDNINISRNNISNNSLGISVYHSDYSTITGNIILNNSHYAIQLYGNNNFLSGNLMDGYGLRLIGFNEFIYSNTIDNTNLLKERPVYYYKYRGNLGPGDFINAGQIFLAGCSNSLIANIDFPSGGGISLFYSDNNVIENITVNHSYKGIILYYSDSNIIANCTINSTNSGIFIDQSNSCNISGNEIYGKYDAIYLSGSNHFFSNNKMYNGGFQLMGDLSTLTSCSIDSSNLINGRSIYLYKNEENLNSENFTNPGQIILINCTNSLIFNLDLHNGAGIFLIESHYINISRNEVNGERYGMWFDQCNNNIVSQNTITSAGWGIYFMGGDDNTISNNDLYGEDHGIAIDGNSNNILGNTIYCEADGIGFSGSNNNISRNKLYGCRIRINSFYEDLVSNNIDSTNLINDKPLRYYIFENNLSPANFTNPGQIILVKCNYALISSINLNNSAGITLIESRNNIISGISVNNSMYGIYLYQSNNNVITGCTLSDNKYGLYIFGCEFNTFYGNAINHNIFYGMYLHNSNQNTITENYFCNNGRFAYFGGIGFYLTFSSTNIISNNTINNNFLVGIQVGQYIGYSNGNNIYLNSLSNNSINAYDLGSNNFWDNGEFGNFWADYEEKYPESTDNEGIWTIPYDIDGSAGSIDRFPLNFDPILDLFPIAQFNANATEISVEGWIQFADGSRNGNLPKYFQWDFGDDSVNSTEQNPIYCYKSPGVYSVTLTVTDYDGDVSTITKTDYIRVIDLQPISDFTANVTLLTVIENTVQFSFNGTEGDGSLTYQWDFGDGSVNSTDPNPIHQYDEIGKYTVTLTITDRDGDMDVETKVGFIIVKSSDPIIPGYSMNWLMGFVIIGLIYAMRKIIKKKN